MLREAVLSGLGIGLWPDFSAMAELDAGRLVAILPDWRPLGFVGDRIYAFARRRPRVPRAVQCLVDYLKQTLQGKP